MRAAGAASDAAPFADTPWAPAQFRADGEVFQVDVRLLASAEGTDSLLDQAWRVRFSRKRTFRGIRELTLEGGRTLEHARESVVREIATLGGLLAPPSGLALLRLNGQDAGVVFWSECSSAEMLERLGYAQGEILTPLGPGALASPGGAPLARGVVLASYAPEIDRDGLAGPAAQRLRRLFELVRSASDGSSADLRQATLILNWFDELQSRVPE